MGRSDEILYHAHMRVLQSRQGRRRQGNKSDMALTSSRRKSSIINNGSRRCSHTLTSINAAPQPCPLESLAPPSLMLSREKAFRHSYLKHHQPSKTLCKIESLSPSKKAARFQQKREEIFERIRAAERAKQAKNEPGTDASLKEKTSKIVRVESRNKLPRIGCTSDLTPKATSMPEKSMGCHSSLLKWGEHTRNKDINVLKDSSQFAFLDQWAAMPNGGRAIGTSARSKTRARLPALL